MKRYVSVTAFILSLIAIFAIFSVFFYFITTKNATLDTAKLNSNDYNLEVYSSAGNLISNKAEKGGGKYIKISSLNSHTKNAFIAIEDRRFYSHGGIDLRRIIGATLKNAKSLSFKEGASTITQQLVKNTHLSSEKTIKRKLSEIKIAFQIENRYSKDEILEYYLNTIYFGKGAYGIESASNLYFDKSASELSINESAVLAGMIKSPANYSPITNYDNCFERKNLVLSAMKECGYISLSEYEKLKTQRFNVSKSNVKTNNDYISSVIEEYENSKYFTPYSKNKVKITTYLDEDLQQSLCQNKIENFALSQIVINSKNGGIIAFYGNNSNLKRSPASCVKPWLVYAPMINDKYIKESSVILDEQINLNGYSPKNYSNKYYGKVTVKTALSKSLNVPAVKLLNGYGIKKANNYTKNLGVDIENENLSCALGSLSKGLSLKELCDAYSPFNNDGNYQKSSFIKEIFINNLKVYSHQPKPTKVFSSETCYIISDILKDAVNNGNSKKLRALPFEVCAKTGTNGNENGNIDALSVSYTTDTIVGVWIGNEDNSLMPNSVTGSNEPTAITNQIYKKIYKNHSPLPFTPPNSVIKATIDENYLLTEELELLSPNGTPYYYAKGTEPTTEYSSFVYPKVINAKTSVQNGVITLNFTVKHANYIEIYKEFNNKTSLVYSGNIIDSFSERLIYDGVYNYKLKLSDGNTTFDYDFQSVNYKTQNLDRIKNDNWFYE
ncbi:MAG: penicillin-binding protein [Clostridia bacterium]|nr:penicillin-binding protein [Clostridia bacterium]